MVENLTPLCFLDNRGSRDRPRCQSQKRSGSESRLSNQIVCSDQRKACPQGDLETFGR